MRNILAVTFPFLLALAIAGAAELGTVTAVVEEGSCAPLAGAQVSLHATTRLAAPTDDAQLQEISPTGVTDGSGSYRFHVVEPGTYRDSGEIIHPSFGRQTRGSAQFRASPYAVSLLATSSSPRSLISCSRIRNFCTFLLTVIGKPSTKRMYCGILK